MLGCAPFGARCREGIDNSAVVARSLKIFASAQSHVSPEHTGRLLTQLHGQIRNQSYRVGFDTVAPVQDTP